MINKLLVVLTGGGDTTITLVPAAAKQWIESPYPNNGNGGEEKIPAAVMCGHEDSYDKDIDGNVTVDVSRGSGDNDRAIEVIGIEFDTTMEAVKFAKENLMTIVDEYHGCIY